MVAEKANKLPCCCIVLRLACLCIHMFAYIYFIVICIYDCTSVVVNGWRRKLRQQQKLISFVQVSGQFKAFPVVFSSYIIYWIDAHYNGATGYILHVLLCVCDQFFTFCKFNVKCAGLLLTWHSAQLQFASATQCYGKWAKKTMP